MKIEAGIPLGNAYLHANPNRYTQARDHLLALIGDARSLNEWAVEQFDVVVEHVLRQILPRTVPAGTPPDVTQTLVDLATLVGAAVAFETGRRWCTCGCAVPAAVYPNTWIRHREYLRASRDRTLAAIILTAQVTPHLMAPEVILLAADDVTRRWYAHTDPWTEAANRQGDPAGRLAALTRFVDAYCTDVEERAHDGASGDPDEELARIWFDHATCLALDVNEDHPALTLIPHQTLRRRLHQKGLEEWNERSPHG